MNGTIGTAIVLLILAVIIFFVIRSMVKVRKTVNLFSVVEIVKSARDVIKVKLRWPKNPSVEDLMGRLQEGFFWLKKG